MFFLIVGLLLYILVGTTVYFLQEKLIFHPEKLVKEHAFDFDADFDEIWLEVAPAIALHALHFKAENSKGLVFYVHGNAGSLQDWGHLYQLYTDLGYDLLMFDYRGFGKSDGQIFSEEQFYEDVQKMYDYAKTLYTEPQIIVQSFSIGSAAAARLVSQNKPRKLIMKAPYYSLTKLVKSKYFFLPGILLKYTFSTASYLRNVSCPVYLFHGTIDELIPHSHSVSLKKSIPELHYIEVDDCLHNDIPYTQIYQEKMKLLLD